MDQMANYKFTLEQTLSTAHPGAFLPRDLFYLDPAPVVYGDLDPSYTGLLFPDSGLETSDLVSLLPDSVPEDVKSRVLLNVKESYTRNCERVQNLHTCVHAYVPTCIHAYMHTFIYACMHTYPQPSARARRMDT